MRTATSTAATVLLLAASAALGRPHDDADADKRLWNEHMGEVRAHTCGSPQPRAVSLQELGLRPRDHEALMPAVAVLRRCSQLPHCCGAGMVWGVAEQQLRQLVFRVKDTVRASRPSTFLRVAAIGHTRCRCVYEDESEDAVGDPK